MKRSFGFIPLTPLAVHTDEMTIKEASCKRMYQWGMYRFRPILITRWFVLSTGYNWVDRANKQLKIDQMR